MAKFQWKSSIYPVVITNKLCHEFEYSLQSRMIDASIGCMRPILFSVGSLNFYSYGFFTAIGFLAGGYLINYLAKQRGLISRKTPAYFVTDALLFALVIGLIVARLSYIVIHSFILRTEPLELATQLLGGGFIFYAGLAAGLAAIAWWMNRQNQSAPILAWLDIALIGVSAGFAVSEVGGYLNDGQIVHLTGLVGASGLAVFSYYLLLSIKEPGRLFRFTLFLLFLLLFFLGFWRLEKVIWYGFNFGQWVSLIGMIGVASTFRAKK